MSDSVKKVLEGGTGEIVEKKSRFIATVFSVASEEEAVSYIEATKKKYWDARHNCYAYVIGERGEKQKCSDDGEPQGTAGRPMLDVLLGSGITNILVIVTRYFGGVLLGTGGLVRAYSQATKAGIDSSRIATQYPAKELHVYTDYTSSGKIRYIAEQLAVVIDDTLYTDNVEMIFLVTPDKIKTFTDKIMEATSAAARIEEVKDTYLYVE